MKNILLFLFGLFCGAQSFAQDPDLYQTWYLSSYSFDQGDTYYLADVIPFLPIDVTIDNSLTFSGEACNEYAGAFTYDAPNDLLVLDFFDICLCGACNNPPQSHVDLENNYFSYYFGMEGMSYEYQIWTDPSTGIMGLTLESIPGFILEYQNVPVLGISEKIIPDFTMSPNPTSDFLSIISENQTIKELSIYSLHGNTVMKPVVTNQSIDVSLLSSGIYFLEITTENGKAVERFIKD